MKLYTEEQVKRAIDIADDNPDLFEYYDILSKLTPIELPTDEEVEAGFDTHNEKYYIFTEGAKWVIEQIKEQAKSFAKGSE